MKYHYQEGLIIPFAQKYYRQLILAVAAIFMASFAMMSLMASAATQTLTVTNVDNQGWVFNPDPDNETPYNFTNTEESIGTGSLYVQPISGVAAKKFIALKSVEAPAADVASVSFDFQIEGAANATKEEQFYLNVYTNLPDSETFYDCRFDFVATSGSTSDFTTLLATTSTSATAVGDRTAGGDTFPCPDTWGEMPEGSTISAFTLNVGDTSLNDTGVAGFLDNVVVTNTNGDVTTYDFERAQNAGEITSPAAGEEVSGELVLGATYEDNDPNDVDGVQWAVRAGTCAASTDTVAGNVDGSSDDYAWDGATFAATLDSTAFDDGEYCFVFNPADDAGENNVRETVVFSIRNNVYDKEQCKEGGWMMGLEDGRSFKNQGDCVSYWATGERNQPAGESVAPAAARGRR